MFKININHIKEIKSGSKQIYYNYGIFSIDINFVEEDHYKK